MTPLIKKSIAFFKKACITGLFTVVLYSHPAAGQVVQGIVLEELSRAPVPQVEAALRDSLQVTVTYAITDSSGIFSLRAPKPGSYFVYVRRIGYTENLGGPYELGRDDTLRIQMRVLETVTEMDEITVEAERIIDYLDQRGFYDRQRASFGNFMTREDIENKIVNRPSELFRDQQGVRVSSDGQLLSSRERTSPCHMTVVLDGMVVLGGESGTSSIENRLRNQELKIEPTINHIVNLENIVGIEVYRGSIGAPLAYTSRRSRCGTVLIWTYM